MGKGKKKSTAAASSLADSDDALIEAAIAANKQAMVLAQKEKEEEARVAKEVELRRIEATAKGGVQWEGLTQEQIVEKLSEIPTFAIMHATEEGKKFVPMTFKEGPSDTGMASCAFFAEPAEAKFTLQQAKAQHPDMDLVLGVMPLGKAYALCEGWAEAQVQHAPFTLRAEPKVAKDMRPVLKKQLELQKLPSQWTFPVFICEELQSPTCLPVFLTREGLAATWKAAGKSEPPPKNITVTDLRILVSEMQKGFKVTGCDWSIVKFLGSESAWDAIKDDLAKEGASGAAVAGPGKGVLPTAETQGEQKAAPAEPEDEEPPVLV